MTSVRALVSSIAFFFVLFFVSAAHAGPIITAYGQTLCILGGGNGTSWEYEIRPFGGGTPHCSGTLSFSGTQAQFVADLQAELDLCTPGIGAYPTPTLPQFSCPGGTTGFTIPGAAEVYKNRLAAARKQVREQQSKIFKNKYAGKEELVRFVPVGGFDAMFRGFCGNDCSKSLAPSRAS